jgi:hypothetical protein
VCGAVSWSSLVTAAPLYMGNQGAYRRCLPALIPGSGQHRRGVDIGPVCRETNDATAASRRDVHQPLPPAGVWRAGDVLAVVSENVEHEKSHGHSTQQLIAWPPVLRPPLLQAAKTRNTVNVRGDDLAVEDHASLAAAAGRAAVIPGNVP